MGSTAGSLPTAPAVLLLAVPETDAEPCLAVDIIWGKFVGRFEGPS